MTSTHRRRIILWLCLGIWVVGLLWGGSQEAAPRSQSRSHLLVAQGLPSLVTLRYLRTRSMILYRPFQGSGLFTNGFDHDQPRRREEPGRFVTLTGKTVVPGLDQSCGRSDGHAGYDWQLPERTPILAAAEGWVTRAGLEPLVDCPFFNRSVQGLWVVISHRIPGVNADRYESLYAHLSQVRVQEGQWVQAGTVIGLSGNTGCSTGPHLHFEIRRLTHTNSGQPTPVDPYGWRGTGVDPWAEHPKGARSELMWLPGQAPDIDACLTDLGSDPESIL